MSDWHKQVYCQKYKDLKFNTVEWRMLRDYVIKRDHFRCLRCDKKFSARWLSVHHLIPRSEGGEDNLENLVTLCNKCHDIVEIEGYKTRAGIIGSYIGDEIHDKHKPVIDREETFIRPEWHAWVYGGDRTRRR